MAEVEEKKERVLIKDRLQSKIPSLQDAYLSVAADAEAALEALGKARRRAQEIVDEVAATGTRQDIEALANYLGMRFFDGALLQSAGSKGLLPLFDGNPEHFVQVGVRVESNAVDILKERMGVEPTEPKGFRRAEEGREKYFDKKEWEEREKGNPVYVAVKEDAKKR